MKRRKGLFGRSKEGKQKKGQQSSGKDAIGLESSISKLSLNSSLHSDRQEGQSPLLLAKAARNSELLTRNPLEVSQHSASSGTIFVPVNEDSVSGSLKSGMSFGSLSMSKDLMAKSPSTLEILSTGRLEEADEFKLSEITKLERNHANDREETFISHDAITANRFIQIPSNQSNSGVFSRDNRLPSTRVLIDRLFAIDGNDFVRGERYLRLLRDSLDIEGEEWQKNGVEISYHPEEAFLAIKRSAEKFYAQWMDLKAGRDAQIEKAAEKIILIREIANDTDGQKNRRGCRQ